MAGQPRPVLEPVLKQFGNQRLCIRQSGNAVPDIARWEHPQLSAQDAGTPAVVGNCHNGRKVRCVLLETAQKCRQSVPSANGDDLRSPPQEPLSVNSVD